MVENNINIRKAIYSDCSNLSKLKREIWETTYRGIFPDEKIDNYDYEKNQKRFKGFIDNEKQELYVVENNNELVGYTEFGEPFRPFEDYEQEIGLFYIRKDYQRRGIGKKLFNLALDYIRGTGVSKFFISCHKYNTNAQEFYKKMGGKIVHVDEDYENDGSPQVKFEYII